MNPLAWVIIAALGGAALGVLSQWLASSAMTARQIGLAIISAIIAVLLFAGAFEIPPTGKLTAYKIISAVIGGWGAVMGRSTVANNLNTRKLKKAALLKSREK